MKRLAYIYIDDNGVFRTDDVYLPDRVIGLGEVQSIIARADDITPSAKRNLLEVIIKGAIKL